MTWKISHFKKTKCLSVKVELFLYTQLTEDVKVHITRKVSHFRNTLIQKAFQYWVKWCFSFCDIFFCSRDFKIFLLCKFSHWWRHRLCKYIRETQNSEYLRQWRSNALATWQECWALRNISDGTHFNVAIVTCLALLSFLFKNKYYNLYMHGAKYTKKV